MTCPHSEGYVSRLAIQERGAASARLGPSSRRGLQEVRKATPSDRFLFGPSLVAPSACLTEGLASDSLEACGSGCIPPAMEHGEIVRLPARSLRFALLARRGSWSVESTLVPAVAPTVGAGSARERSRVRSFSPSPGPLYPYATEDTGRWVLNGPP